MSTLEPLSTNAERIDDTIIYASICNGIFNLCTPVS